jgi:hypothetical protein
LLTSDWNLLWVLPTVFPWNPACVSFIVCIWWAFCNDQYSWSGLSIYS